MRMRIAERLRPFSHQPGTQLVLPGSGQAVEVFPTLIKTAGQAIPLEGTGPVKEFTVQLDLEKGCVWVWGFYREGYRRYCIWSEEGQFRIAQVRGDEKEKAPQFPFRQFERLSLGSHKKQDFCLVKRRGDLAEIVPHWMRLAQLMPSVASHREGTVGCLDRIPLDKNTLHDDLLNLFYLGFHGILHPQLEDPLHLGFEIPSIKGNPSPLALITEGAKFLRRLFIQVDAEISILPCVPRQFHCGRFIGIDLGKIGRLDIEWSKKRVRRMIFESAQDQEQTFFFSKDVKHFRLRQRSGDLEEVYAAGKPLAFQENTIYDFDRFEK